MERLTERDQVRTVACRWRAQYGASSHGDRTVRVADELDKLNTETATAAEVAAVVGSKSWVSENTCDECESRTWDAVQLGQTPEYESRTATICRDCLRAALRLLGEA